MKIYGLFILTGEDIRAVGDVKMYRYIKETKKIDKIYKEIGRAHV